MAKHNIFDDNTPIGNCGDENVFVQFLSNGGLYDVIPISEENIDDFIALVEGRARISVFCKECKEIRVFAMEPISFVVGEYDDLQTVYLGTIIRRFLKTQKLKATPELPFLSEEEMASLQEKWSWIDPDVLEHIRVMCLPFQCTMNSDHRIDFVVAIDGLTLRKIGQYPSVADLSFPELKEYSKVIPKDDIKEIHRAIGLYAQGIGVGSYVYLRRIFEKILESAKEAAAADGKIDPKSYKKAHVDERITMLGDYLPEMMVKNPAIYGIISKGIHELSEEECIAYFPVMQESIFMILRQWDQKRKEAEDAKKLSNAIAKIAGSIK